MASVKSCTLLSIPMASTFSTITIIMVALTSVISESEAIAGLSRSQRTSLWASAALTTRGVVAGKAPAPPTNGLDALALISTTLGTLIAEGDAVPGNILGGIMPALNNLDPSDVEALDTLAEPFIHFDLCTTSHPDRVPIYPNDTATPPYFDNTQLTKIIIHGYRGSAKPGTGMDIMKDAFLSSTTQSYNVILVDYSELDSPTYVLDDVLIAWLVSHAVAKVIGLVREQGGADCHKIHVIGFSLGAHIASFACAEKLAPCGNLTGLDVASPLYENVQGQYRFNSSAAGFVEAYHTSHGLLGMIAPVAMLDIYINGGRQPQPGCPPELLGFCAHCYVTDFYIDLVYNPNSRKCPNLPGNGDYVCTADPGSTPLPTPLGPNVNTGSRGVFWLTTEFPEAGEYNPICPQLAPLPLALFGG